MRINFDTGYIELQRSKDPTKIVVIIAAKQEKNPYIENGVGLTSDGGAVKFRGKIISHLNRFTPFTPPMYCYVFKEKYRAVPSPLGVAYGHIIRCFFNRIITSISLNTFLNILPFF